MSGRGRHSKTTTISSIKDNLGNTIHDEKCIADQHNKYFVEIGPKLSNNLPVSPRNFSEYLGRVDCEFQFSMINNDTVYRKIMKLKPKKATGLDRIPHKLVKNSAVIITPFLNHIFNISLSEEKFPDDWKKAKGKSQGSLFLGHTVCARCRKEEPLTSAATPVDESVSDPIISLVECEQCKQWYHSECVEFPSQSFGNVHCV